MISNSFCPLPFKHLNLKSAGKVSACCMDVDFYSNDRNKSLEEIWNSKEVNDLRDSLLNGEQPDRCKKCWDFESSGASSLRIRELANTDKQELYQIVNFYKEHKKLSIENLAFLEIRFDTICNLACKMCGAHSSHKWAHAVKKDESLYNEMKLYGAADKIDLTTGRGSVSDEMLDEIVRLSPNIKRLWISGGEPMYSPKHYDFLTRLLPEADHITIFYATNLTMLDYKGNDLLDIWKKFKRIELRASIDGHTPELYQYVRTTGNLKDVEKNILRLKRYPNITLNSNVTVSILNILYLPEILEYFHQFDFNRFQPAIVQYPRPMNCQLLPKSIKEQITEKWNAFENKHRSDPAYTTDIIEGSKIINFMNSKDLFDTEWVLFQNYITSMDNHFNSNVLDILPEFKPYW